MFRFEDPTYLYALLLLPVLVVIRFLMVRQQQKRLAKFGDPSLVSQLSPELSRYRPAIKFCLALAALALLIIMWARPQFGTKISQEKRTGIETVICLDVSNSMLAEDVAPSRLDRSKMMVENLVDQFSNDKIALIVFAGDAFVQLPITSDYVSAKMFLSNISPGMIANQGTDIAAAVNMASHSFTQDETIGKAIIVITDGEDHEGGALEAASSAKDKGQRVYVLGVGSTQGAPIPTGRGDYMKDNRGETVMSALNEEMCRQVAEAGGGAYIHVGNNSRAQDQLENELDKLAKKEIEQNVYSDYDEQFQAVAILALLMLVLEICILEVKNPRLSRISLFSRKKTDSGDGSLHLRLMLLMAVLACSQCLPTMVMGQSDRRLVRQGNSQFKKGNAAEAEVKYRKALEQNPRNAQAAYNLGTAMMNQHKDSTVAAQLMDAARLEINPLRRAQAYHNMGVMLQQNRQYGEAIEAYKEALRNNPADDATRYNLELCKHQQKKQQQQQQQQQQQKQDDQKKQDDQQKQDNKQQQKKQEQEPKQQMSKENAEQLLNAAIQEEKNTQERMKKAMQQPQRRSREKNW